jgi:7-keto-8-aminopelargonate synthetase-like enzyme
MFSNDGSIAPLDEYAKILPRNSMILVDDAHGAGVLGRTGKGTLEQTGVSRARIIQTVTLSKAFGVYGGAILCDKPLRDAIISKSGMFAGSTPLPLPLANAANTAVQILQRDQSLRHRLQQNVQYAKSALREVHRSIPATHSPIIALTPKSAAEAAALCKRLLACKVFPSFIQYPGGPPNGYFRFVISSEHTSAQLDALLRAFRAS